jgi:CHAD domain-containing protein
VRELLERRRDQSHQELEASLTSRRARQFRRQWPAWLTDPVPTPLPDRSDRPVGPFVAKRIQRSFRTLVRDGRAIGDDSPADELHELRKDAKRLRYFVECFGSVLPVEPTAQLTTPLKELQDVLGRHQDAEVHADLLQSLAPDLEAEAVPGATLIALGRLLERLDDERRVARSAFAVRFAAFDQPSTRRAVDAISAHLR